ncbi:MAG: class IV adenylate cyclase [Patescibacteria group bacterium]
MTKNKKDHKNIEIKAKCSDFKKIRKILISQKADFKGIDHQIDTYFKINNGRLKLREGNIENDLIFYNRENKKGPKKSEVILLKNNPKSSLKKILEASLGKLIVVDKHREIFFIKNVKFHLDKVKNLGTFVEIEAIDKKGNFSEKKLLEQCNFYLKLFRISKKDLVNNSYSDLLIKNKK